MRRLVVDAGFRPRTVVGGRTQPGHPAPKQAGALCDQDPDPCQEEQTDADVRSGVGEIGDGCGDVGGRANFPGALDASRQPRNISIKSHLFKIVLDSQRLAPVDNNVVDPD